MSTQGNICLGDRRDIGDRDFLMDDESLLEQQPGIKSTQT
jgi:hypothetical protein